MSLRDISINANRRGGRLVSGFFGQTAKAEFSQCLGGRFARGSRVWRAAAGPRGAGDAHTLAVNEPRPRRRASPRLKIPVALREGSRSRTAAATDSSRCLHPTRAPLAPPPGFPLASKFPSRLREGPTVSSLSASPHCPRAFLETGFPGCVPDFQQKREWVMMFRERKNKPS
jgi:hypothetical protein